MDEAGFERWKAEHAEGINEPDETDLSSPRSCVIVSQVGSAQFEAFTQHDYGEWEPYKTPAGDIRQQRTCRRCHRRIVRTPSRPKEER